MNDENSKPSRTATRVWNHTANLRATVHVGMP